MESESRALAGRSDEGCSACTEHDLFTLETLARFVVPPWLPHAQAEPERRDIGTISYRSPRCVPGRSADRELALGRGGSRGGAAECAAAGLHCERLEAG